jgi:hypothetical protein
MEMLIKYTPKTSHIKCLPLITTDSGVKLTRSQVELSPGINEVSEDEWAVMQAILAGDDEIAAVKTEAKSSADKPKHARALKDAAPAQAVGIVRNCSSGGTLKKWYRTETREFVLLAILKQLKKLNIDPFEDAEDEASAAEDESVADENDNHRNDNPEGGKKGREKPLEKMTKEEMLALAAEKGVTVAGTKREEILAALKAVVEKDEDTK